MINFTHRTVRAVGAAATLLGAVVLASPVFAASTETLAQATSQQAMAAPGSRPAEILAVEARI